MKLQPWDHTDRSAHLWTDLPDAEARLREHAGPLSKHLQQFIRSGYAVLDEPLPAPPRDALLQAIARELDDPETDLRVRYEVGLREWALAPANAAQLGTPKSRLPDLHLHLAEVLPLSLAPAIVDFLATCFEDEVVAFQSLFFEYGSTQPAHNDTAYVVVAPPNRLVASWIALEDVKPGSGELFVYAGSHRMDEQIFDNGLKQMSRSDEVFGKYGPRLEDLMREGGYDRVVWRPDEGRVLFWSPNLIHGGMPMDMPAPTRRSLVTHYCPLKSVIPVVRDGRFGLKQYADRAWYTAPLGDGRPVGV